MHPPFFVVDHKVGPRAPQPGADRPILRRSTPEALTLGPPDPHSIADRLAASVPPAVPQQTGGRARWLGLLRRPPTSAPA